MSHNKTDIPSIRSKAEWFYIQKRKLKAFFNSLCFYACRIFPVRNNLISVCTFEGKGGFGCNPKYIVKELHKRNPDYEFVWFVNDLNKEFPDYIKKVPNTLWSRAYWLGRSRVWIDNYRKPYGTVKRKGQIYINTWHGSIGFKSIGLWRGSSFSRMAYLVSKNDSDMIDRVIIDSSWGEEMYPKGLIYQGDFLKAGTPRCDILYGDREHWKKQFREKHHLSSDSKLLLFAPTFRETSQNGKRSVFSEVWTIDFERLLTVMENKFGGNWYLCMRLHPQISTDITKLKHASLNNKVLDVSKEDDMYEILAAMDACVTDYSSTAMDACFCSIPVFLYADDIEKYINDRGSMLWNLSTEFGRPIDNNKTMTPQTSATLPFILAQNNDELEQIIMEFDLNHYQDLVVDFKNGVGLVFDGKASCKVADFIERSLSKLSLK